MTGTVQIRADEGTGRAFVLLFERGSAEGEARALLGALSPRHRVLLLEVPVLEPGSWRASAGEVLELLKGQGVRQVSFVAFGPAAAPVQYLCLTEPRFVRTMALVDAVTRPHASRLTRLVDRLESWLPLGLPLRLSGEGFDCRPFLQRIRCPVLIITTPAASEYVRGEGAVMADRLPTAWQVALAAEGAAEELARLVATFTDVPAKCPQRSAA